MLVVSNILKLSYSLSIIYLSKPENLAIPTNTKLVLSWFQTLSLGLAFFMPSLLLNLCFLGDLEVFSAWLGQYGLGWGRGRFPTEVFLWDGLCPRGMRWIRLLFGLLKEWVT